MQSTSRNTSSSPFACSAAVFLASDECFMTGENLQVNGGLCLRRNPRAHELMEAAIAAGEIEVD